MKLLLDNRVHYGAKRLFEGHDVLHARDLNWRDLENGKLLAAAAEAGFNALVSTDKNIRHQQSLPDLPLPVIELNTVFTRIEDLTTLLPFLAAAVVATASFRFVSVRPSGWEGIAPY